MVKRLAIYINEMFPITAIVGSIITALAIQLVYLKLYEVKPMWGVLFFLPGIVLTCVSLLIRIMDEFKDYKDDLVNFPNRPLPSGKVKKNDLMYLGIGCVVLTIFLSSWSVHTLVWGLITLVFTGLMLKWFFMEEVMRKSLPLAFITHHPIVVFNFIYLIIASIQMDSRVGWEMAPYILPVCLIYTNWEVARKLRAPEQETSYTTYSKIFGPRVAVSISLGLQLIFTATVLMIFEKLGSPLYMRYAFLGIQLLLSFSFLKFLFTLKLKAPLRPVAEGQILVVVGFLLAAAVI